MCWVDSPLFPDATGIVANLGRQLVGGGAHGASPWGMLRVTYVCVELRYLDAPEYFHMAVCVFPEGCIMVGSPWFGCAVGGGHAEEPQLEMEALRQAYGRISPPNSSFAQRGGQGECPASTCSSSTCGARSVSEDVPGSV